MQFQNYQQNYIIPHLMANASDLILEIIENKVFSAHGDYSIGYKIVYPEKYTQGDSDLEDLNNSWSQLIRNLPLHTIITKSDVYIKTPFDSSVMKGDNYIQNAEREHFCGRTYIQHTGYIFFTFSHKRTFFNNRCLNPFSFPNPNNFFKTESDLVQFTTEVEQATGILKGQYSLVPLSKQEIIDFTHLYFNGFQTDYYTDLEVKKHHISVNDNHIGIFSITHEESLPNDVPSMIIDETITPPSSDYKIHTNFMEEFGVTLDCTHIYNQIIYCDDLKDHLSVIDEKKELANKIRNFDLFNQQTASELATISLKIKSNPENRLIRSNVSLLFCEKNKSDFERLKNTISSTLKRKEIQPIYATGERLKDLYYSSFFTNNSLLGNNNLFISSIEVAVALFTTTTTYQNDKQGIFLCDRIYNTPICYDFFDVDKKRKNSRNFAIIADTGSGKSFFTMDIFWQLSQNGTKQIILDVGNSFERMYSLFPPNISAYVEFSVSGKWGLNPFIAYKDENISEKIESLCDVVHQIIYPQRRATDIESTTLRQILNYYYSSILDNIPSFDDFYNFIVANKNNIYDIIGFEVKSSERDHYFNIEKFMILGKEYTSGNIYGNCLSAINDNNQIVEALESKQLILFELSKIKDNPRILQLAILIIKETIRKVALSDRLSPVIVHFEEFAQLLKIEEIKLAVEDYTATIRKYNGAIGIVLQTINQLPSAWGAESTLDNISTIICLEGTNVNAIEKRIDLPKFTLSQIRSLRNNFNASSNLKYSEICIWTRKGGSMIYRVESSLKTYLAFQTEGDLYEIIKYLNEHFGSNEKAIDYYISMTKTKPKIREEISDLFALNSNMNKHDVLSQYFNL